MYSREMAALETMMNANMDLIYMGRHLRSNLLSSSQQERDATAAQVHEAMKNLHENLDKARGSFESEQSLAKLAALDTQLAEYEKIVLQMLEANKNAALAQSTEATALMPQLRAQGNAADATISELVVQKKSRAKDANSTITDIYEGSRTQMIALILIAAAVGFAIGILVTRSISRPLNRAMGVANSLAEGDLTVNVESESRDETGRLLASMQHMTERLRSVMADVRSAADSLSSASEEVSATSQSSARPPPNRPPASRRPPPRSSRCPPPSRRTPRARRSPTASPARPPTTPFRAARRCARWSRP